MNKVKTLIFVFSALLISSALVAQAAKPDAPKTQQPAKAAQSSSGIPSSWEKVPIPPLHQFKPQEPKRIELSNGMVIFLQEDHELPLIEATMRIRGGYTL